MSANVVSTGVGGIVPGLRLVQLVAPGPGGANDSGTGGGGDGPDDPMLTARVEALERGLAAIQTSLQGIEKSQADISRDLTELRRELKERDIPAIKAQLSGLDASLAEKPKATDLQKISTDLNRMIWTVFGFVLALVPAVIGAAWGLKKIGVI